MAGEPTAAAECGACGERAVYMTYVDSEALPECRECEHQPSMQVYRENRIRDLLPPQDEWPDDSGVLYSPNAADEASETEVAVLLVLGPREWKSLGKRASLEFHEGVDIEVVKGAGPGVGFGTSDGEVGSVEVRLPSEALRDLHDTGHWSASVGPSMHPLHMKVVVLADA